MTDASHFNTAVLLLVLANTGLVITRSHKPSGWNAFAVSVYLLASGLYVWNGELGFAAVVFAFAVADTAFLIWTASVRRRQTRAAHRD